MLKPLIKRYVGLYKKMVSYSSSTSFISGEFELIFGFLLFESIKES
jgi:hypothetical protein